MENNEIRRKIMKIKYLFENYKFEILDSKLTKEIFVTAIKAKLNDPLTKDIKWGSMAELLFLNEDYIEVRKIVEDEKVMEQLKIKRQNLIQKECNFLLNQYNTNVYGIAGVAEFTKEKPYYDSLKIKNVPRMEDIINYIVMNYKVYVEMTKNEEIMTIINDKELTDENKKELLSAYGYDNYPEYYYNNIKRFITNGILNINYPGIFVYSYTLDYLYGCDIIFIDNINFNYRIFNIKAIEDEITPNNEMTVGIRYPGKEVTTRIFIGNKEKYKNHPEYDKATDSLPAKLIVKILSEQLRIPNSYLKAIYQAYFSEIKILNLIKEINYKNMSIPMDGNMYFYIKEKYPFIYNIIKNEDYESEINAINKVTDNETYVKKLNESRTFKIKYARYIGKLLNNICPFEYIEEKKEGN